VFFFCTVVVVSSSFSSGARDSFSLTLSKEVGTLSVLLTVSFLFCCTAALLTLGDEALDEAAALAD